MPKVSEKGLNMPASPIRRLVPYADGARARGTHVYHLNIGQPDLETPPVFWETLKEMELKVLAYCPSNGLEGYREKFAQYYRNNVGIPDLTKEQFVITTGASEALFFTLMSCLNEGDELIIPEPLYANYVGFASAGNIKIVPITTSIDTDYALPAISDFEKSITDQTRAILICNPNNPTGYLYSREELRTLKEIVIKHDLFLLVDEVYREFAYDGRKFHSIFELEGLDEHVVVFDSISKRFSACGARIGAIVSRNKTLLEAVLKFAQARLSPPTLGQIAGEKLFDLSPDYFDHMVEEYINRRDFLVEQLRNIEGVKCPKAAGAFYTMVQLPVDNTDKFCQWLLESFSHDGQTVMLAPGSGFYATPGLGTKEVRIAYVLNTEDLKKAMICLEAALKEYPGRTVDPPKKEAVLG